MVLIAVAFLVMPAAAQPAANDGGEEFGAAPAAADRGNPFTRRVPIREFPKDMEWLNTSGPLRMSDLRGKFVLFDFWTYCCINCMHVLPELKKLERAYPNELVVIGVHSGKFETERDAENIAQAIQRYEIEHPAINDDRHILWNSFGVDTWPTILIIDPEGYAVWRRSGEFKFEEVNAILQRALPHYRRKGTLDRTPIRFDLLADRRKETPLRFPGKVLADETSNRLFIADSNHNRLVIADLSGRLMDVIGSGAIGAIDGDYLQATFNHPQGMALHGEMLYVADTENHLLRKIDLREKRVTTVAGTRTQAPSGWSGPPRRWVGRPTRTALASPWDLWVHRDDLYIAMAGTHQIWTMPVDESEIGPYAGNASEDIVDGPLLSASFAQPSGLASDGQWLYVADSEGSSIRAVPFDPARAVTTVVGTAQLPTNRLFEFGDVDGRGSRVRLQHVLGVTHHDGKLYLADTYNDKVKELNLKTLTVRTIAGGKSNSAVTDENTFDEPAGVSYAAGKIYVADTNNHRIRTIDLASQRVETLEIQGLTPPAPIEQAMAPPLAGTPRAKVAPAAVAPRDGKITLRVHIDLPQGWKMNELAPNGYRVEAKDAAGPVVRAAIGKTTRLPAPTSTFTIDLPVLGEGKDLLDVGVTYYYCQEGGEGLCKVGSAAWTVAIEIKPTAAAVVELTQAAR
jgi:thiol-disulfide isomerase/thioredoxin